MATSGGTGAGGPGGTGAKPPPPRPAGGVAGGCCWAKAEGARERAVRRVKVVKSFFMCGPFAK